jgi:hypothetical protein
MAIMSAAGPVRAQLPTTFQLAGTPPGRPDRGRIQATMICLLPRAEAPSVLANWVAYATSACAGGPAEGSSWPKLLPPPGGRGQKHHGKGTQVPGIGGRAAQLPVQPMGQGMGRRPHTHTAKRYQQPVSPGEGQEQRGAQAKVERPDVMEQVLVERRLGGHCIEERPGSGEGPQPRGH